MNELIKVTYDNDTPVVSARDLHSFLAVGTEFRHWFPRMCEYGFAEGADYTPVIFDHPQNGQATTDYAMRIDMAKEISMPKKREGQAGPAVFYPAGEILEQPGADYGQSIKAGGPAD